MKFITLSVGVILISLILGNWIFEKYIKPDLASYKLEIAKEAAEWNYRQRMLEPLYITIEESKETKDPK